MPNFLKDNNYNWNLIKCVDIADVVIPSRIYIQAEANKESIFADRDKLELLTIVLDKNLHPIDNIKLLMLRILLNVKTIYAVVLE